jgi:hypothetical protein
MKKTLLLAACAVLVLTSGCIRSARRLSRLELGMSRQEVIAVMGEPLSVRASKEYSEKPVVMLDYGLRYSSFPLKPRLHYWMVFREGALVQWGQQNDFGKIETADYTEKIIIQEQEGPKPTPPPRFPM